ncbi:MAG: hypothetical protein EBU88_00565 [Acidobacteria bacterium]|nr:hypothetical protein [Acidobacteriota bacterium]
MFNKSFYLTLIGLLLILSVRMLAQQSEMPFDLPATIAGGWQSNGRAENKDKKTWVLTADRVQGEIISEYGLQRVTSREYRSASNRVKVRLFIFNKTAGAYGWWSFSHRTKDSEKILRPHGQFVIEAESVNGSGSHTAKSDSAILGSLLDKLKAVLPPDDQQLPVLPAHLPGPAEGLVAGSERIMAGPKSLAQDPLFAERVAVIDFSGSPDLVTADYQRGSSTWRLLLVEFYTPQSATESFRLWEAEISREKSNSGTVRTVRRIGNYIAELAGSSDQSGADEVLGKIRYEQKIYWAGKKVSDIPLEFRPVDPAALREATKTGTIIVQSLIWIGMMMAIVFGVGLMVGGSFFYLRRFRERRKGADRSFTDGGGSIMLNLQDKE